MLFDTLRRKNQAEQEEREWNANRPADYVSQNKDAMDSLTGQIGSGFDWDTSSKAYQQYRQQAQADAAASAENAQANAAALAGGYGSSYADSVARQGQQQALSGIDNAVPGLRSQALSQYQNQQNSLLTALSGMANTEALDRSAYGANFANYENQQAFLANQSQQARNENDNYWNNLWNQIKNVGNIAKTAYDGYMGYTYQQELLEMQKQQQKLQDAQMLNNLFAVNPDMARQIAQEDGYDSSIFDNYSVDGPVTRAEKANAYLNGTQLLGSGYVDAAGNYASLFGVDPSSLGSYTDAANLAFDDWARRQMFTKSLSGTSGSSGRSSGSSGSSGKSGSGWTNSELRNLMKDRNEVAAKGGDTSWYDNILAEAGYPVDSGQTSTKSTGKSAYNGNNPSTGGLLALSGSAGKYGSNQTAVGKDTNNILTANLKNSAVTAAKAMQTKGKKEQEIYNDLRKQGYTDNQILYALNQLS